MEFWIFFFGTRTFPVAKIGLSLWKLLYSPKKYMKGTCSNQETLEKSGKKAEGSPLYHHINNGELSAKIRYENDAHLNNLRSKIAHRIWKPKVQIHLILQRNKSTPIILYISWSDLRLPPNPCSKLKKRRLVMTPPSNFANKRPTIPERRYSGRYGLELFKTVRLAFIGSIFVEIAYRKRP